MPILIGIGLVVLISCMSLTPAQRAEARQRAKRLNWLWFTILILELAFVFWPRQPL